MKDADGLFRQNLDMSRAHEKNERVRMCATYGVLSTLLLLLLKNMVTGRSSES